MKRITLLGIGLLLLGQIAFADTTCVAGGVRGEWTAEHSPYVVTGYLLIETGDTLSIGPGVRVYFTGPYFLHMDSASTLRAVGAEGDSIVFTGRTDVDSLRWAGINCTYSSDTLRFEYCVIENATGQDNDGAINSARSDIKIEHCSFLRNVGRTIGDVHGAALHLVDSYPPESAVIIRDCLFEENVGNHGGAVALHHVAGIMERCVFRNNHAAAGGAIYGLGAPMQIVECEFYENSTRENYYARGGAIWYEGNYGQVIDCLFMNNHAHGLGGAISDTWGGGPVNSNYIGNRFIGNTADSLGGALVITSGGSIKKCLFDSNSAPNGGALYYIDQGTLTVTQCTFSRNVATLTGSAISSTGSLSFELRLVNSIIAFNEGSPAIHRPDCALSYFRNNLYWGNEPELYGFDPCPQRHAIVGTNQNGDSCDTDYGLYLNPLFVDAAEGDFHLLEESPSIDAGFAANVFNTTNDPDSTPPDIGVFYFHQTPSASEERSELPSEILLAQNYPNPFNAETTIEFSVPVQMRTTLELFDITGRQVRTLYDGMANGRAVVRVSTDGLASGVYVYRLTTAEVRLSQKMLLLK